jgi:hypothetical protein
MSTTTAELLNDAVYKRRIMWTDLSARIVKNDGCSKNEADEMVARLIKRESVTLGVAVALIDLIVE